MKWNKKTDSIYLAVGHGTQLNGVWDSGCAYSQYTEAALMLPIVKAAVKLLRKSGVKVYTDADKGNNINMTATCAAANQKKVTLYASVHNDYAGSKSGIMFYYGSAKGKAFGDTVCKYMAKIMGLKFKGGTKDTAKYEVGKPIMPSVILELGSIKEDISKLKQSKKYGRSLAKGICKYIGVEVYVSNRAKLARKANELAYPKNPKEAKYPSGKPTPKYKKGLKHAYPKRATWSKPARLGASCDVFMGTCVRESGVDKGFPRGLSDQIKYLEASDKFKRVKNPKLKDMKDGYIVVYKNKTGNKGHIWMFHSGKCKHASYNKYYPRTTNSAKSQLSSAKRKWVRVYTAKG